MDSATGKVGVRIPERKGLKDEGPSALKFNF